MRQYGGRAHGRRRLHAALERLAARVTPASTPGDADAQSRRFIRRLEDAILELETRGPRLFEHVTRRTDHVEDLRRVLGTLLDILADWETATGPAG